MMRVRGFVFRVLMSLGVLIAAAIFDLGPAAQAAYLPVAGATADQGAAGIADDSSESAAESERNKSKLPVADPAAFLSHNGPSSGAGSPGSSSSPPTSLPGVLLSMGLPQPNLVARLVAADTVLILSAFVNSILDPPRML